MCQCGRWTKKLISNPVSNCQILGEMVKGSRTLLSLAAASLFPQLKLLNRDMHCDTAEHTTPRQERYHSFLNQHAFLKYVKREIAASRERPLAAMEACVICQLHMETWWKNIQWHIGTSHHFSFAGSKKRHNTSSIVCPDKRWKAFLCAQRRHTRQWYQ